MEGEDTARTRGGIAFVAEESLDAGGFVEEGQLARADGLDEVGQIHRVMRGLLGNARQQRAFLLGFDDADGLAIDQQQVIAGAGLERCFAQRDALPGGEIHRLVILRGPAGRDELGVDLLAGACSGARSGIEETHEGPGVIWLRGFFLIGYHGAHSNHWPAFHLI